MQVNYTTWNNISDKTPDLEAPYLVMEGDDCGVPEYSIQNWYVKGTTITLRLNPEAAEERRKKANTAEEKLLFSLFEPRETVEIKETGFYRITGDFGENNDEYPGCAEWPVLMSRQDEDVYWATLPLEPEGKGLKNLYKEIREEALLEAQKQKEREEKQKIINAKVDDTINEMTTEGGIVDKYLTTDDNYNAWRESCLTVDPDKLPVDRDMNTHENCIELNGCIYPFDERERKISICAAIQAIGILDKIAKEIPNQEIMDAFTKNRVDHDSSAFEGTVRRIFSIIEENDHLDLYMKRGRRYRTLLLYTALNRPYAENYSRDVSWWKNRLSSANWFASLPIGKKIVMASSMAYFQNMIYRLSGLEKIKAPNIIIASATWQLVQYMYAIFNLPVAYTVDYEGCYHHTPAGKFLESPEIPDYLPKFDDDGNYIIYEFDRDAGEWKITGVCDPSEPGAQEFLDEDAEDAVLLEYKDLAETFCKKLKVSLSKSVDASYKTVADFASDICKQCTVPTSYTIIGDSKKSYLVRFEGELGIYICCCIAVLRKKNGRKFGYDSFSLSSTDLRREGYMVPFDKDGIDPAYVLSPA